MLLLFLNPCWGFPVRSASCSVWISRILFIICHFVTFSEFLVFVKMNFLKLKDFFELPLKLIKYNPQFFCSNNAIQSTLLVLITALAVVHDSLQLCLHVYGIITDIYGSINQLRITPSAICFQSMIKVLSNSQIKWL